MKVKQRSENHYITNKELYEAFCNWKQPREPKNIPIVITKGIMSIVDNLAKSGNFRNYPMLEDMKGNAVYLVVKGCKNFDETKSKNPFAFLTQIAFNSFRADINKEHSRLATEQEYRKNLDFKFMEIENESHGEDDFAKMKQNIERGEYADKVYKRKVRKPKKKEESRISDKLFG